MENSRPMNEEKLEAISGGNTGADMASGAEQACTERRSCRYDAPADQGSVGSLPDVPGLGLYTPGHVGVYVGNGMAVSARSEDEN